MGAVVGLTGGVGVVMILASFVYPLDDVAERPPARSRGQVLLAEAGMGSLNSRSLVSACLGCGLIVGLVMTAVSGAWVIGAAFAVMGAYLPVALLRSRARKRRGELRALWPDVIDGIASAVRAGMSLPEALAALGTRGPESLREPFALFAADYRASGAFNEALDRLKERLADPTGDRIVETLRMARDVGGRDLGRMLRTLSGFLREEGRARAELETRQGWVVNAARVAAAGPWLLLLLLSFRSEAVQAYQSVAGMVVLAVGAGATVFAYRCMVRIGRLPEEARVLQ